MKNCQLREDPRTWSCTSDYRIQRRNRDLFDQCQLLLMTGEEEKISVQETEEKEYLEL